MTYEAQYTLYPQNPAIKEVYGVGDVYYYDADAVNFDSDELMFTMQGTPYNIDINLRFAT